jgi:DNA polymerase-3 subunit beta
MGLKASVMTASLIRELAAVSKAASTRGTLPILYNVLIETTDGGLYLTATDLTSRLRAFVPGKVDEAGSTTVDIKTLTHLLGQCDKAGRIDLSATEQASEKKTSGEYTTTVTIPGVLDVSDSDGTAGHLATIPADEMPIRLDPSEWPLVAKIDPLVLRDRLDIAIPFCAADEARPILTGVYVQTKPDKVTFGAADNYSLTGLDAPYMGAFTGLESNKVVPAGSLKLMLGLLAKVDHLDGVEYRVDESGVGVNFSFGPYDLTISAIDGQYPRYEEVIPRFTEDSLGITVGREALLKALKIARPSDPTIRLHVAPNTITVEVMGDGREKVLFSKTLPAVVKPERDEMIGFNPRLLAKLLDNARSDTVTLYRNGDTVYSAYGLDSSDPSVRFAVMPVKLGS